MQMQIQFQIQIQMQSEPLLRSEEGQTAWELACTVDCMQYYAICTSFPSNSLLKCTKCTLLAKCNNLYEQRARSRVRELLECTNTICGMQRSCQKDPLEHSTSLSGQYLRNITGNCKLRLRTKTFESSNSVQPLLRGPAAGQ